MTDKHIPSPEELRKLLRYEPETGKLFWLPRPEDMFATHLAFVMWNKRFALKEAFITDDGAGYKAGEIYTVRYKAHRVIWAIKTGEWPKAQIDHINGDRGCNRWGNLRLATPSENSMNSKIKVNNTSGVKGVWWNKRSRKWTACITVGGKRIFLGYYDDISKASIVYAEAAKKHHGEFARTWR